MNGAETTIHFLSNMGVSHVFGMPGGANLPLYDALSRSDLLSVLARHEQGAAFMAQGYARKTGKPGVCFATSGPGAANLLTAIADARADSVPVIAITGQVPRYLRGTDAFQELDVAALARPITKACYSVEDPEELPEILAAAFQTALCGRPGPVWIDIPRDVQLAEIHGGKLAVPVSPRDPGAIPESRIKQFKEMLSEAERPLLYFGGGVAHSGAASLISHFIQSSGIPAVSSLNGLGVFSHSEPLYAGFVGVYGFPAANRAVQACDLLIAVGARFDDRATGRIERFCPRAKIVHVDIDARELGKIIEPGLAIQADASEFLKGASGVKADCADWRQEIQAWKQSSPGPCSMENPEYVMSIIDTARFAAVTTDVGLHQMWAARSLDIPEVRHFLTSGGMGTMGFGLPAAIGASFASGESPVLCITGDGSLLLNVQELSVVAEYGLPVKVLLLDNGHLGMVRSQQHSQFEGRISSSRFNGAPAFGDLARAFGIPAVDRCASESELTEALYAEGPALIRIEIDALLDVSNQTAPAHFKRAELLRGA